MSHTRDTNEDRFSRTHWSVVLRAAHGTEDERVAAMNRLCHRYWTPLYAFLRGSGRTREEAEDVVQEFFVRLMDGRLLAAADPARGKFRTLMLTALRNLDTDLRRAGSTQKRGGSLRPVPLDSALAEEGWQACAGAPPDAAYDRAWASALVQRAGERLQAEFEQAGKAAHFAVLFPRISRDAGSGSMAEVAEKLGITESAAKMIALRMRRRYAAALREEVAATVGNAEDGQDELSYLLGCFA